MSGCPPHRWRIESPDGPTVRGTCVHCGLQRIYPSAMDDARIIERWASKERSLGVRYEGERRYPRLYGE